MEKYLKDHPYMEPDGLQEEQLEEKFSEEERRKRAKKCDNPKGFTMKQFCKNQKTRSKKGERTNEGKDPKKGTGKKPKGSGRRLYTDENPKDTVRVKFRTVKDIRDTLSKASFKSKSHKRQSQIINLIHQRARAAYRNAKDPKVKKRLKKAFDYATKRKEASKRKTKRMQKMNEEVKKIIAYHGSNVPIRKFSTDYGAQGVIWFTQDRNKIISGESGALSSNYIMKVELDVDKVAGWPEYDKLFLKQIEDQGYDSIKLDDNWVIFDPKRIKVLQIEQRKKINEQDVRRKVKRGKIEKQYFGEIENIKCIKNLRKSFENEDRRFLSLTSKTEEFYDCMKRLGYDRNIEQEKLRSGTFRAVMDMPNNDDVVLKVVSPKTRYLEQALKMNQKESQGKFQTASELAPKVYDSADDYFWTIVEKATPIKTWSKLINDWFPEIKKILKDHKIYDYAEDYIPDIFQFVIYPRSERRDPKGIKETIEYYLYLRYGFEREEALDILDGSVNIIDDEEVRSEREYSIEKEAQNIIDKISNIGLISEIRKVLDEFNLPYWDIRPSNVGSVIRNGKKQFVLLDPGFGLNPDIKGKIEPLKEEEPFQKAVKKNYRKMKIRLIGKGGNKYVSPGMTKPSYARAKSAPPGFGGSLEEAAEKK